MKKFLIPSALAFACLFCIEAKAQDPKANTGNTTTTVERDGQQDPTVKPPTTVSPEKKDSENRGNTTTSGKSEKIAIGDEGDVDDKKKNSGTNTVKNPTIRPNTTNNTNTNTTRDPK